MDLKTRTDDVSTYGPFALADSNDIWRSDDYGKLPLSINEKQVGFKEKHIDWFFEGAGIVGATAFIILVVGFIGLILREAVIHTPKELMIIGGGLTLFIVVSYIVGFLKDGFAESLSEWRGDVE